MCKSIVQRIRTHAENGNRLFMLNYVNDHELAYCYDHAKALIFPSSHEGFGLPIVEALNRKLAVMASDIPVHREVGANRCVYFSLDSPENLAQLIIQYEKEGVLRGIESTESLHWPNWSESCREMIEMTVKLAMGEFRNES